MFDKLSDTNLLRLIRRANAELVRRTNARPENLPTPHDGIIPRPKSLVQQEVARFASEHLESGVGWAVAKDVYNLYASTVANPINKIAFGKYLCPLLGIKGFVLRQDNTVVRAYEGIRIKQQTSNNTGLTST